MGNINEIIQTIQEHKDAAIFAGTLSFNVILDIVGHNPTAGVVAFALSAAGLSMTTEKGAMIAKAMGIFSAHIPDEEKQIAFKEFVQEQVVKIHSKDKIVDVLPSLEDANDHYFLVAEMLNQLKKNDLFIAIDHDLWHTINIQNCYHIVIAGQTGNGKTTLIRQLLMQMILNNCSCYLIDPMYKEVKGVNDERKVECWAPLASRMPMDPAEINESDKTRDQLFQRLELKLDERRKQRGDPLVERKWKPIFVFVDEGAYVVRNCPNAEKVIGRIVKEGRQLKIFLVLVSQSTQVQSLGINTADLSQFCTRFYLGGDDRTRSEIMPQLSKKDGQKLKKLQIAMTTVDDKNPAIIQLPYLNNEELYAVFGEEFIIDDFQDWFEELENEDDDPLGSISISTDLKIDEDTSIEIANDEKIKILKFEMTDEEMSRIIQAFEDLIEEDKTPTPNAIQKKLGVNWDYQKKIEYVAELAGYDIIKSNVGRKKKETVSK